MLTYINWYKEPRIPMGWGGLWMFMPLPRHFHLEMLNILIPLFFSAQTADLTSYITFHFSSQRTAQQAKERSQMKRSQQASKVASDITRFLIKKWNGFLTQEPHKGIKDLLLWMRCCFWKLCKIFLNKGVESSLLYIRPLGHHRGVCLLCAWAGSVWELMHHGSSVTKLALNALT